MSELGTRQFFSFATTTTRQCTVIELKRQENPKNVKASCIWSSLNEYRHIMQQSTIFGHIVVCRSRLVECPALLNAHLASDEEEDSNWRQIDDPRGDGHHRLAIHINQLTSRHVFKKRAGNLNI